MGRAREYTGVWVYEGQLAVSASGAGHIIEDPNLFYAVSIVQPGRTTEESQAALIGEFDRLKTELISDQELQRAKNQFARDYVFTRFTVEQKALHLSHAAVIHDDITTADAEFDIFMNITKEDVRRVAPDLLHRGEPAGADDPAARAGRPVVSAARRRPVRLAALLVLLALVGAAPSSAGQQPTDWPRESPPPPLPARQVTFPPYAIRTLANGLQVVVVRHHEQPAVILQLMIGAGAASDPDGKNGVAALTGHLLDQGTTSRTATEIADTIDTIGGILNVGAGMEQSFVSVLVMTDSFEFGADLVADIARNPSFAPAEIERQRQQVLSGLQVSYDDPTYLAGMVFGRLVYGFHPYGMPHNGTPASVLGITRDDLRAFHETYYAPNNALLGIVGDIDAEAAFAAAERVFADWERKTLPPPYSDALPEPTRRVVVIDKPGSVQTAIRVGHVGLARASPDFLAFDVAIKILGGEGGNRLGSVLRTERSLTYAASADMASRLVWRRLHGQDRHPV